VVGTADGALVILSLMWLEEGGLSEDFAHEVIARTGFAIGDIAFARNGGQFAVAGGSRLQVRETTTGSLTAEYSPANTPYSVEFADGDTKLLSGDFKGTIELWDLQEPGLPREISFDPWKVGVCDLAVSPDGLILGAGFCDYNMMTWDIKNDYRPYKRVLGADHWECTSHCPFPTNVISYSPDGTALVSGTDRNYGIHFREIETGRLLNVFHTVRQLMWTDPESGQQHEVFVAPSPVYGLAFTSDGSALAIAVGNEFQVRETSSGDLLFLQEYDGSTRVVGLAVSPNGYLVATADDSGEVLFWGVVGEEGS
jgi:WD40 repeat protein